MLYLIFSRINISQNSDIRNIMRKDVGNNVRRIITSFLENGPQTTSELVGSTGLSRDTIYEYCKRSNLIRKNGKFQKYYLTGDGEIYRYPSLKGQYFSREAMRILGSKHIMRLSRSNNKQQLKEFADEMGALIVYGMIQSLAPRIWNPNVDGVTIEEKIGKERDLPAKQWLRNCFNPLQLLIEFSKLEMVRSGLTTGIAIPPPSLHRYLKYHCYKPPNLSIEQKKEWQINATKAWHNLKKLYEKNKKRDFNPYDPYQSNFEVDNKTYNNLLHVLEELYPDMLKDFEKIWNGLDDEIKGDLSFARDPRHLKCKGKKILVRESQFEKVEQCIECKRYFQYFSQIK